MATTGFIATVKREWRMICSRPIFFWTMIAVPVAVALFFVSLMSEGLPLKTPTAVVDLDDSQMSRQVTRSLNAVETVEIQHRLSSFHEAMEMVDRGEIFGFFYIPEGFQREAVAGRGPTLSYYSDMTYFVPGTLAFKGFKTLAVSTSGSLVKTTLVSVGLGESTAGTILQPVVVQDHEIGNPWTNYSIYLSNSFVPGVIELMVLLVTVFSICQEIKLGSSVDWLRTADDNIAVAVAGKLLPQTVIFTVVGLFVEALLFGFCHFPLNGSVWGMILAMFLMVVASQALALFISSVIVNLRLALSGTALIGILAFSVTGFSFPVQSMYGAVAIFSYILPVRYYFLIYVDQALNGIPLYYSRWYFVALMLFPVVATTMLWHLKRMLRRPVYLP